MDQFQIIASTIMISIIVLVLWSNFVSKKDDNQHRLSAEEKAFLYSETSDIEFEQTMPFDVTEAIKSGNKLQAIKHYRTQFGTSLKESKLAVERMARVMKK